MYFANACSQSRLAYNCANVQVVALCNTYTCQLFLSAASATRTSTVEELTAAVGGKPLMRLAQLANIILLFGAHSANHVHLQSLTLQELPF